MAKTSRIFQNPDSKMINPDGFGPKTGRLIHNPDDKMINPDGFGVKTSKRSVKFEVRRVKY